MTRLKYTLKNDTLFKMLFVKYPDLLKSLVAELLGIKYDNIEQFTITNPEIPQAEFESWAQELYKLDLFRGIGDDEDGEYDDEDDYSETDSDDE